MSGEHDARTADAADQTANAVDQLAASTQQIANCLGFLTVRFSDYRKKPKSESIPFLNSLGFDRHAIAAILDTTPNTVSVRLSQLKASKRQKESAAAEE